MKTQGCSDIGLILRQTNWDSIVDWEYPFWVLLQGRDNEGVHLEHFNVKNVSALKYKIHPFRNSSPCAIISLDPVQSTEIVNNEGDVYINNWSLGPVNVLIKQ